MIKSLSPVINVDKEKCVNCHACIAACPVKTCMDASGDTVSIIHDQCIGCGNCIRVCSHGARTRIDDFQTFLEEGHDDKPLFAIAAPAVVANFPGQYKNLFGWIKSLGVQDIFDISFGAELTVKSYLDHINRTSPKMVIAQPCPAIVSFIEIYLPELLPYLAPADSPMLHTIKMVREYYPEYRNSRVLVLSPCLAKKREFEATGMGDYNVTYASLSEYIEERNIDLSLFPQADFVNPPAERAVLFSSPGGLMQTVTRERPELLSQIRKIEGPEIVYDYLKELPEMVNKGMNPTLIDCLNCEKGCNGGPGTLSQNKPIDEIEFHINQRMNEAVKLYEKKRDTPKKRNDRINGVLEKYWKPNLYSREYKDRSSTYTYTVPDNKTREDIYKRMQKYKESDFLDCPSCGYYSCEIMADCIANGLNQEGNCHHYRQKVILAVTNEYKTIYDKISGIEQQLKEIDSAASNIDIAVQNQSAAITESSATVEQMMSGLQNLSAISSKKSDTLSELSTMAHEGESHMEDTVRASEEINTSIEGIAELITLIDDVAERTTLLSMNAAIEAARAGSVGKGFAVVSTEIKKLADKASENTVKVTEVLSEITAQVKTSTDTASQTQEIIMKLAHGFLEVTGAIKEMIEQMNEMSIGSKETIKAITLLRDHNAVVSDETESIQSVLESFVGSISSLSKISKESMETINNLTGNL